MGCCCSCHSSTTAGSQLPLSEVSWDGGGTDGLCQGIEVGGIPLSYFLSQFSGLGPEEQIEVASAVVADLNSFTSPATGVPRSSPSRCNSGICHRRPVSVGVFSWNVGGISDNRKEAGAGVHESSRGDVLKVLAASVKKMGAADIIVVGLQETISLTPHNAMKAMSSAGDSRLKTQFYSWPATVAQWVELLLQGLNGQSSRESVDVGNEDGPGFRRQTSDDEQGCSYALYGQPVYLFGLLLCVFCRTVVLKHIKDFGMMEMAMDKRFKSGAKGVVACRFVLFDRSFCFINCHLSAQKKNGTKYRMKSFQKRVMQIQRIWTEVKFKSQVDQMVYPVSAHRAVFLLGDTNFRISLHNRWFSPQSKEIQSPSSDQAYADLWVHDQLFQELHRQSRASSDSVEGPPGGRHSSSSVVSSASQSSGGGQVGHQTTEGSADRSAQVSLGNISRSSFASGASVASASTVDLGKTSTIQFESNKALMLWREPVVSPGPPFPPTFKLDVPGPGYSKKRVAAWTDRVLFRSQHAEPQVYDSARQAEVLKPPRNISDHDPVFARFEVECVTVHSRKLAQLIREVRRSGGGSPTHVGGRRTVEQALSFQANVVETAQPEIEDFARRLFTGLQEVLGPDEAVAGAAQILEYQEECWHLVCSQFESLITDSIRRASRENGGGGLDTMAMNQAIQQMLEELRGNWRGRSVYVV